jgi:hypothetical protein
LHLLSHLPASTSSSPSYPPWLLLSSSAASYRSDLSISLQHPPPTQ